MPFDQRMGDRAASAQMAKAEGVVAVDQHATVIAARCGAVAHARSLNRVAPAVSPYPCRLTRVASAGPPWPYRFDRVASNGSATRLNPEPLGVNAIVCL